VPTSYPAFGRPWMPEWAVESFGVVLLLIVLLWVYLFIR